MKVILDMDPGIDDAVALTIALGSSDIEILGVTVVSGNVHVDQGVRNVLRITDYLGKRVNIYRGSERPLIRDLVTSEHIHGSDGLGDSNLPLRDGIIARENAIKFIVESILNEKASIVATGPLTNIAKAILIEPGIASKVEEIVVMGGCFGLTKYAKGNVTPYAEYNFYVDPEAAKIVIRSGARIRIIGLDVTQNPSSMLTREKAEDLRRVGRGGELIYRITRKPLIERGYFELHDAIAMASKIDPNIVAFKELYVSIDTCYERGRSHAYTEPSNSDGKTLVGYDIDSDKFYSLLRESLK
ncbi:MAG TPA: nucleoside hydrolase [Sulfolobales archaeon]|nr:nucleoside hydrolase [Sulfolobales archaeon]